MNLSASAMVIGNRQNKVYESSGSSESTKTMRSSAISIVILFAACCGADRFRVQAEAAGSYSTQRRRRIETKVENIKLVLTPQSIELTEDVQESVSNLFDEALENFVGLHQSLSRHAANEFEIETVTSAVREQMVDSVFVIGAAAESVAGGDGSSTGTRSRSLLNGMSSGTIVSHLVMRLSIAVSLYVVSEEDESSFEQPNLEQYIADFFSEDGDTSAPFVEAARHIHDENGNLPLANLQVIGVGKSRLYDSPYSYLDRNVPATSDNNNIAPNRASGATIQDSNIQPSSSQDGEGNGGGVTMPSSSGGGSYDDGIKWIWYAAISGAGAVLLAMAGVLATLVARDRRRKRKRQTSIDQGTQEKQQPEVPEEVQMQNVHPAPLSVLNCDVVPLPITSPVSFDLGDRGVNGSGYTASNTNSSDSKQQQEEHQRYAVLAPQTAHVPASSGTPISPGKIEKKPSWSEGWFAKMTGFVGGEGQKPTESSDEDSKGNEIPKLSLPPKKERKQSLQRQREEARKASEMAAAAAAAAAAAQSTNRNYSRKIRSSNSSQRSVVDDLLGSSGRNKRTTPKDGRHALHIGSDDLYVIPEDDASL